MRDSLRSGLWPPGAGNSTALRLVAAATGSLVAAGLASLLYVVDPFLAAPALIGVPLGAAVGFIAAPFLVDGTPQRATARAALLALVAVLCGLVGFAAYDAWGTGWYWFPAAVFVYSGAVAILALPPALVVSIGATHLLRRLAPHAGEIWKAAVVALLVSVGIAAAVLPGVLGAIWIAD